MEDTRRLDFKVIKLEHFEKNVQASIIPVGVITEESLAELLKRLVDDQLLAAPGHSFNSFNIHAYRGVDEYDEGMGRWMGWYYNTPVDLAPKMEVRFIDLLTRPEEVRFGLSEEARRLIFVEVWSAETAAMNEANRKYPTLDVGHPVSRATMDKHSELEELLRGQKMEGIAQAHNLTQEQLKAIGAEAQEKNWPGVRNN